MWDEPVNDAIDEVARQMTEGAPTDATAFRRRVLARIDAGDAPRRSWRATFVLTPIGVAAAITIAVIVSRPAGPKGPAPQTHEAVGRLGSSGPGVQAPATDAAGRHGPALRAAVTVRRPGPSGPGVSRRPGPSGPNVSIRETIDPLKVAPLTLSALTADPISIEEMDAIAPLTLAPLDISDVQRRQE
jgi:hypothetical protein